MKTLEQWQRLLDGESHPWPIQMGWLWRRRGAREFMKCPAIEPDAGEPLGVEPSVAGAIAIDGLKPEIEHRRPILCPEPPPFGRRFILCWNDGTTWRADNSTTNGNSESLRHEVQEALLGEPAIREMLGEIDRRIQVNAEYRAAGPKIGESIFLPHAFAEPVAMDAILDLILAAMDLGRAKERVRRRDAEVAGNAPKSPRHSGSFNEWKEIIHYAHTRHGLNLGAEDLVEAMGGNKEDAQIPDGLGGWTRERFFKWESGVIIEDEFFKKCHKAWRDENPKGAR